MESAVNCYKQSLYVGFIRIAANIAMLCALFFAMYVAAHSQMGSLSAFCLYFFGITIPVWMLSFYAIRKVREHYHADDMSVVELPRIGRRLVRWQIRETPTYVVSAAQ